MVVLIRQSGSIPLMSVAGVHFRKQGSHAWLVCVPRKGGSLQVPMRHLTIAEE